MSYYTSSTLLDYGNTTGYGGGVGGGSTTSASRYDSLFGSSLTGGSTSAYRLVLHCLQIYSAAAGDYKEWLLLVHGYLIQTLLWDQ